MMFSWVICFWGTAVSSDTSNGLVYFYRLSEAGCVCRNHQQRALLSIGFAVEQHSHQAHLLVGNSSCSLIPWFKQKGLWGSDGLLILFLFTLTNTPKDPKWLSSFVALAAQPWFYSTAARNYYSQEFSKKKTSRVKKATVTVWKTCHL